MKKIKKLLSIIICGVFLFGTGCSNQNTSAENQDAENISTTENQETQATEEITDTEIEQVPETKIISTSKGYVEIPTDPQRVLVDYIVGDVVALGVKPIALSTLNTVDENNVSETIGQLAFGEGLEDLKYIGWGFDPETAMSLEPDLIILSWSDEGYEDLSKIAPTVYVPYGELTTEERVNFVGEILSKEDEAKEIIDAYNQKAADAYDVLANAGIADKFVTVAQLDDGQA